MRNAKGVSHTARVRGSIFGNEEKHVLFFTGMEIGEYFDMKYDMGKRWCLLYMKNNGFDAEVAEDMYKEKVILQVWNNAWRRLDHYLIVPALHKVAPNERKSFYADMHMGVFLKEHPHYEWLEISLAKAVKKVYTECKSEAA